MRTYETAHNSHVLFSALSQTSAHKSPVPKMTINHRCSALAQPFKKDYEQLYWHFCLNVHEDNKLFRRRLMASVASDNFLATFFALFRVAPIFFFNFENVFKQISSNSPEFGYVKTSTKNTLSTSFILFYMKLSSMKWRSLSFFVVYVPIYLLCVRVLCDDLQTRLRRDPQAPIAFTYTV